MQQNPSLNIKFGMKNLDNNFPIVCNDSFRCKKILPTAMAAYKEGLPQHYTQEYHQVIRLFVEHQVR